MTNEVIIEKMKKMKFYGMVRSFQSTLEAGGYQNYTPDELISYLIESEWDDRQTRKIERHVRLAKFRYKTCVEHIYYDETRNLDKNQMLRYASCDFIRRKENIIITGATGVGKSYIASALGNQACLQGLKVIYFNMAKLLSKLKMLKADGSYLKEINRIEKQDLVIFDDFGLQPMDNQNRLAFLEIIEDRHDRKSSIITSQIPVDKWHEIINDKTIADAILDRLVHASHRIELMGESMRKKKINI
jgi:DNA replication protein DnaC